MSYKTILVHLDPTPRCSARVDVAIELARRFDAHLVGLAATGDAQAALAFTAPVAADVIEQLRANLAETAEQSASLFDKAIERSGFSRHERRISSLDAIDAIALHSRYTDLVVVGQADDEGPHAASSRMLVERTILGSGRPTLIVPRAGNFEKVGRNVMVAWDASRSAARAVADAMPVLCSAEKVEVIVVNARSSSEGHGDEPGADVALYLARHGVNVSVRQQVSDIDIGNTLLSHAFDIGADMLVMGGYGHSRLRELVMGGATRSLLAQMTLPVLMSH